MKARLLYAGILALIANSAYLAAAGNPHPFYFANLLLHLVLGLAVAAGAWVWWRRDGRRELLPGALLLALAAVLGVAIVVVGNRTTTRPLVWAHVAAAVLGVLAVLAGLARHRSELRWKAAAGLVVLCLIAVPTALWVQRVMPDQQHEVINPPAPLAMADEAMHGAAGPFFPSSVHTASGDLVPSSIYLNPESCARSGCHPDIYEQWHSSAHHFSSFNNQWYRKSIEYMQEVAGVTASKWCGGCHDPALLQSGMMDTPIEEILDTPEAQAGLTCTACHMISTVRSSMGQGDYEITVPPLHRFGTSENRLLQGTHDFLVRLDPEPHRRTFIKPVFRNEFSPEYCSSCHKVHLDVPVNSYRWIRGFNEYDNWQASGVSGYGARSFYYPPQPRTCIDCHMPHVESDDAGHKQGLVRSHRFATANTALPVANQDEVQLQKVIDFLQANQVTVDIFAMTAGRSEAPGEEAPPGAEAGQLATTFAIGEEEGVQVGTGRIPPGPVSPVYAPLDRIPATVRRGESTRIDVVVRTRNVGHFFPGGTVDAFDVWLELKAVDETGRIVYWSGMADESSPVEPGAHFYRSLLIDAHANPINKRNAWAARAVVYVQLIPPGAADTARFRLEVPSDVGDTLTLTAKLNYRKFSWYNTQWAFAGIPDPDQEGATFTPDYDDRRFVFEGDTSNVSGQLKEIPVLPIVVMDEDTVTLRVVDADTPLPDMSRPEARPGDRERWNDYGIGLLLQGDLRAAQDAFTRVAEIEPAYVDGWVNLGRVAVAEGDLGEAKRVLDRALALDADLARARFLLGLVAKEEGRYDEALEHLGIAVDQYPKDRVVLNQIARVQFLQRRYGPAVETLERVFAIDPEDLMGHFTAMLAYRGLGEIVTAERHEALYRRFKADEPAQELTGRYREEHPHDNNERQRIHEHRSVPVAGLGPAAAGYESLVGGAQNR